MHCDQEEKDQREKNVNCLRRSSWLWYAEGALRATSASNERISLCTVRSAWWPKNKGMGSGESFCLLLAERMESLLAVQWPHCNKRAGEALLTKIKGTGRARKVLPAVKILEKQ